ncbi:hypothetical protein FGB62_30g15 [Gracilaria domingensis]|nr:hypothetical protein FGB62_30g15 [Gracilaria domingensis]
MRARSAIPPPAPYACIYLRTSARTQRRAPKLGDPPPAAAPRRRRSPPPPLPPPPIAARSPHVAGCVCRRPLRRRPLRRRPLRRRPRRRRPRRRRRRRRRRRPAARPRSSARPPPRAPRTQHSARAPHRHGGAVRQRRAAARERERARAQLRLAAVHALRVQAHARELCRRDALPAVAQAVDRARRRAAPARAAHLAAPAGRAARRARRGRAAGRALRGAAAPRRDGARARAGRPGAGGARHHPPGRHVVLCDRQLGDCSDVRRAGHDHRQRVARGVQPVALRHAVPPHADAGVHAPAAGAADDDVQPQAGLFGAERAGGRRAERGQDGQRHPAAAAHEGAGGAVWRAADRLERDGVQAQPDALRAHQRAGALPADAGAEPGRDGQHAVAGAHAGRLGQPAAGDVRGVSDVRRDRAAGAQRDGRAGGVPAHGGQARGGGAAVHGHREHPDGGGAGRRRPADAARGDPAARDGGGAARQAARAGQRPAAAHRGGRALWRGARAAARAVRRRGVCGARAAAGGALCGGACGARAGGARAAAGAGAARAKGRRARVAAARQVLCFATSW